MWRDRTFCQCFFSRDTRKFMARWTFCTCNNKSVSVMMVKWFETHQEPWSLFPHSFISGFIPKIHFNVFKNLALRAMKLNIGAFCSKVSGFLEVYIPNIFSHGDSTKFPRSWLSTLQFSKKVLSGSNFLNKIYTPNYFLCI